MEKQRKKFSIKTILGLFLTSFKIGLFSFGGGYATIALTESEFVEKKKLIDKDEFTDMLTIAESTPGPIAINCSTYSGYKAGGFWGSLAATIGVTLPSFIVIYIISLFFDEFLGLYYVALAFKGIRVCVTFLILRAGLKLLLSAPKTAYNIVVFSLTAAAVVAFSILNISFSSVYYILISAVSGLFLFLLGKFKREKAEKGDNKP